MVEHRKLGTPPGSLELIGSAKVKSHYARVNKRGNLYGSVTGDNIVFLPECATRASAARNHLPYGKLFRTVGIPDFQPVNPGGIHECTQCAPVGIKGKRVAKYGAVLVSEFGAVVGAFVEDIEGTPGIGDAVLPYELVHRVE